MFNLASSQSSQGSASPSFGINFNNPQGSTIQNAISISSSSNQSQSNRSATINPTQTNNHNFSGNLNAASKDVKFDTKTGVNFSKLKNTNTQTENNLPQQTMSANNSPFKPLKSRNPKIQKSAVFSYCLLPQNQGLCSNEIRAQYLLTQGSQVSQGMSPKLKSSPSFSNLQTDEQRASASNNGGFNNQNNNSFGGVPTQSFQNNSSFGNNFTNSATGTQNSSLNFNNTNTNNTSFNQNNSTSGFNITNKNQQAGFNMTGNNNQQSGLNFGPTSSFNMGGNNNQVSSFSMGGNNNQTSSFNMGGNNNQTSSFNMGGNNFNNQSSGLNFASNTQSTGFSMGGNNSTGFAGFSTNNQSSNFANTGFGKNTASGFCNLNQTASTGFSQNTGGGFSAGFSNNSQNQQGFSNSFSPSFSNNTNLSPNTAFNFNQNSSIGSNMIQQQNTTYLFGSVNGNIPAYQSCLTQEQKYNQLMRRIVQSAEKLAYSQKFKNYYLNMEKQKENALYKTNYYNSLNGKQIYAEKIQDLDLDIGNQKHGLDKYLKYYGLVETQKPSQDFSSRNQEEISQRNKQKKKQEFLSKLQSFREKTDQIYEKNLQEQKWEIKKWRNINEGNRLAWFLPMCGEFGLTPSLEKLMDMPASFLHRVPNVKIFGSFGQIHFQRPISLYAKQIPYCVRIEQNSIEILDREWRNKQCQLVFYNFGLYTQKHLQADKNRLKQKMEKWIKQNKMRFIAFEESTGNLRVRVGSKKYS